MKLHKKNTNRLHRKHGYALVVMSALCILLTSCKSSDYKEAEEYKFYGNYREAIELYKSLGDYRDSPQLLIESMISHINITSGKESPEKGLALLKEYRDTLGEEEYYDCIYNIAVDYCERGAENDNEKGIDLFGAIPQSHERYEYAQKAIKDYRILSVSPFIGQWSGVEYSAAVEHDYNISVLINLQYSYGFQLSCVTKVSDETGFVWIENETLFGADFATETELGDDSMSRHFKLRGDNRLWEYDKGEIYSLTRVDY